MWRASALCESASYRDPAQGKNRHGTSTPYCFNYRIERSVWRSAGNGRTWSFCEGFGDRSTFEFPNYQFNDCQLDRGNRFDRIRPDGNAQDGTSSYWCAEFCG